KEPAASGTDPDPQKNKFKHVLKETAYEVPTLNKNPGDTLGVNEAPGSPIPFVTTYVASGAAAPYYDAFDDEGGLEDMTLANGLTVHYDTEKAHNGAAGLILDKITETRGTDQRITRYTYDNNHPNAANTVIRIGRSKDGTTFVERDTQSPSRELKNTQSRDVDPKVQTKTETNYDDYGRPTTIERRKESSSTLSFPPATGSGLVVEQHKIDYFDNPSDSDLSKGRAKEVHSDDPSSSTSPAALDTTYQYNDANTNGQKVTAVDQRRNVTTETEHDSQDRIIHERVYDANTLAESWTGYDASGRVVYTAHSQAPAYDRVESFIKYDALGRVIEVRSTSNKVFGSDQDVTVRKQYSISAHTTTTLDPSTSVGGPQAKTVTTVDKLGRTQTAERQMLVVPTPPAVQQSEISKFGYDSTGLLAYTTDTVRMAGYTAHDSFGRISVSFGIDKLQVKNTYDEWDQLIEQEALGTAGTSLSHAKQKFSHAGHLISRNEQVDSTVLASNLRYRQTFNIWEDGGKKTGVRLGPATGLTADLVGPHIRATEQENDATGRVLNETYGGATGVDPGIAPALHQRKFEEYIGSVPQKTTDISPLRSNASVVTKVVVDGLDRVHSSTVGNTYTTTTDYDLAGNVATVTPPQGVGTIHRDYDGRGLPFHEKRNNDDITNTYDERGALRSYQDETGAANTTHYDVDPLGRVVKVTYPDSTTEDFKYEDKTGLMLAHKDRKDVWLSYAYDEGGRTTQIRKGDDPASGASVLMTRFEYDGDSKRLTRVANKDAAIEFRKYDDLGRVGETVTYRYTGGTGLQIDPIARTVLDVHIQGHAWSVFDGERLSWRFPVTGDAVGASNAAPWLTEITENRDESTNLISQLAGSSTLTESTPAGVGQLLDRFRTIGSQAIRSQYAYADAFLVPALGDPGEPQFGALRRVETGIASGSGASMTTSPAIAGSEVFHDNTARIGQINDLGMLSRKSKFTYDVRGRVQTSKLLLPQSLLSTATPVKDEHNPATFHNERDTAASLTGTDVNKLGVPLALKAEPATWTAIDGSAHRIQSKTLYLDGQAVRPDLTLPAPSAPPSTLPTFTFAYEGGRRTSDGTWNSSFDEFGRLTSIENADRRIEYVYDPRGRIVGRNAYEKPAGGGAPVIETRATALGADGLPAQTTWVWDPVVDRLVAIYETGKSTAAGATPEAGLVRQYLHGDRGYDDPVEVLVATQSGAAPTKYFPIFDEAGTGSLQAVLDQNGSVAERVLYGDSYGDAPHYVQGPAVDKITFTPNNDGSVDIRVRANERIKQLTVASGVSLVALKSDDSVAATSGAIPALDSDEVTIHWHLSGTEWTALTSGAAKLQISVTSSLRTYSWGDTSFSSVPDVARKLYTAKSGANLPVIVTSLLSTLASVSAGTDEPLYEIKSLYMAGFDYSKTKLLTGFQALPYNEPANGLIFARARWYDPSTGSFLTPDPLGYHDASSLYAFAGGDPVNNRDPRGLQVRQDSKDLRPITPVTPAPQIGWVYTVRGYINGEPVSYVGSGKYLSRIFEPHNSANITREQWKTLINDPRTQINAQKVYGNPDAAASGRGTMSSATNEALRSQEEPVRAAEEARTAEENLTVKEGETPARMLNSQSAAKDPQLFQERHGTSLSEEEIPVTRAAANAEARAALAVRGMNTACVILQAAQLYGMAWQMADSGVTRHPAVLLDEGGSFTVRVQRKWVIWPTFDDQWSKHYVGGKLVGKDVSISDDEGEAYGQMIHEIWGYYDWKHSFVPGFMQLEPKVVAPPLVPPPI
ncbi:MAG TPA: RHS repeat-associated core domain-containing protein, partial [Thermoanaerobaculia bacterium]